MTYSLSPIYSYSLSYALCTDTGLSAITQAETILSFVWSVPSEELLATNTVQGNSASTIHFLSHPWFYFIIIFLITYYCLGAFLNLIWSRVSIIKPHVYYHIYHVQ